MSFIEKLPQKWQEHWKKIGYQEPSLIQEKSYESLKKGENILGISPTGSGKTVAYLLPLLQTVKVGEGNQLLILLPSQELGMQVGMIAKEWGKPLGIQVETIIGGANVKRQVEKLKKKPEVIVGTPGRIYELIKMKKIKAHTFHSIVFDEIDQLIENVEMNATRDIIKAVPKSSQVSFFSATGQETATKIQELFHILPLVIDVTAEDTSSGQVKHAYLQIPSRKRVDALRRLAYVKDFKAIVFFNELTAMGDAASKLNYEGVPNSTLASDQNKMERKLAIQSFEEGKVPLLLTTDLACRGLDFSNLPYVIQFDVPYSKETYIHRSGRTGRMGKDGCVITLIHDGNKRDLIKMSKENQLSLEEIFLHSQQLTWNQPETNKEERKHLVSVKKVEHKEKHTTKETNQFKNQKVNKKKTKKRKKENKNKGARRKTIAKK